MPVSGGKDVTWTYLGQRNAMEKSASDTHDCKLGNHDEGNEMEAWYWWPTQLGKSKDGKKYNANELFSMKSKSIQDAGNRSSERLAVEQRWVCNIDYPIVIEAFQLLAMSVKNCADFQSFTLPLCMYSIRVGRSLHTWPSPAPWLGSKLNTI